MQKALFALALLGATALGAGEAQAQFGGGAAISGQRGAPSPLDNEKAKRRSMSGYEASYSWDASGDPDSRSRRVPPPTLQLTVDAGVLMNVKADEYVAVFGISREAATVAEASAKMDATLAAFKKSLAALGVQESETDVDFVGQVRVYEYSVEGQVATEKPAGFELSKNIAIRFRDKSLLDKMAEAAARDEIYDLVKVDYIVRDTEAIQEKLRAEALRVIERKVRTQASLPGARKLGAPLIVADSPSIYYPTEQYDTYTAARSERVTLQGRDTAIQEARKSSTSYFSPLNAGLFDKVINPNVLEPAVQFTAYIRVRYDVASK